MGWFEEQIRDRVQNDDDLFADSFARMANMLGGQEFLSVQFHSDREIAEEAISDILKFYHVHAQDVPRNIQDLNEVLDFLLRPSGIMYRPVKLEGEWYKHASGAMLGTLKGDKSVALIPGKFSGYNYKDPDSGKLIHITKKNAKEIDEGAICFYTQFPLRSIGRQDLMSYMFALLTGRDYAKMVGAALAVTLVGMVTPLVYNYIYTSKYLTEANLSGLVFALVTLTSASIAHTLLTSVRSVVDTGVELRLDVAVESATMMRLLSLPPAFFKKFSAGELASRVNGVQSLCKMMFDMVFTALTSALFLLLYVAQIYSYAPSLCTPAVLITLSTIVVSVVAAIVQTRISKFEMEELSKENGLVFALINGIAKIKNTGSEKRAFAKWAKQYTKAASYHYNPPVFLKMNSVITSAISLAGTIILYTIAIDEKIPANDFMSFSTAFGFVSGAISAFASLAVANAQIKPILDMVEPVLKEVPELDENKKIVTALSGGIELSHVSFRYKESLPLVLDDISMKIRPGQYVAIVGKTGCGKSTLMRILLGFEKPEKGAVYYDGRNLDALDVKSLRHKIGVVMQNGKLFQGDIYSNITISAPQLTLKEAWEAAEMAGMKEDIENMPMGMHTVISEGSGGISGGQRQRLMIARAIAPKPKVLMFDEATSALDNITQKIVSDSLEKLKCTRIVIAHRLSTIRNCDRIIVLDGGKIIEDGTYDELIEKNGFFAELVERQRL